MSYNSTLVDEVNRSTVKCPSYRLLILLPTTGSRSTRRAQASPTLSWVSPVCLSYCSFWSCWASVMIRVASSLSVSRRSRQKPIASCSVTGVSALMVGTSI